MLKSAVSSHLLTIYTARKKQTEYYINLGIKFGGDSLDIIDIIEVGLNNSDNFLLIPKSTKDEIEEPSPRKAKLQAVIEKSFVERDGYRLYKYLFFKVEYGENGQNMRVEKNDGTETRVTADDWPYREFHVFIAYPCDDQAEKGVMLIESRGQFSIQGPIERVVRNCISNLPPEIEKMTLDVKPFTDRDVIRAYIQEGRVSKLRLMKNNEPVENGQRMRYDETEIIYKRPRGPGIGNVLMGIVNNTFRVGQVSNVAEIDNFEPDRIKFEVETESGKRTYTAGNPKSGLIQQEMPAGVVRADGITNSNELLAQMKHIFEEQHIMV